MRRTAKTRLEVRELKLSPQLEVMRQRGDVEPDLRRFMVGDCQVLLGQMPGEGWHLSISHLQRYPTWDEVAEARYALIPDDVTVAMLLPPRAEYVNLHSNCFHLYEIVLPRIITVGGP